MTKFTVRPATDSDVPAIARLFTDSVHRIAANSYSPEQLNAWAPRHPDMEAWEARLAPLTTLVAEVEGDMSGFISFTASGHIELLFTSPAFSRQGVASTLYVAALELLHENGVQVLSTEASLEAKPFFAGKGFYVVEQQLAEREGIKLKRYLMKRPLPRRQTGRL